jgi:hypothetical protein
LTEFVNLLLEQISLSARSREHGDGPDGWDLMNIHVDIA